MKFSKKIDNAENTARIKLFKKASKKYYDLINSAQELEPSMVSGLHFLSSLYTMNDDIVNNRDPLETGSMAALAGLESSTLTEELPMVIPGGVFGDIDVSRIFSEVKAILRMDEGLQTGAQNLFDEAIKHFLSIGNQQLFFSKYVRCLQKHMSGNRAALECEARSQIIRGETLSDEYPNAAIPHFMVATRALRAARNYEDERRYRVRLIGMRMIRKCWFCGRLVQGDNHFVRFTSRISPYFETILRSNNEDLRVYEDNSIIACIPCSNAISKEADRIARHYFDQAMTQIQRLNQELNRLIGIINQLSGGV